MHTGPSPAVNSSFYPAAFFSNRFQQAAARRGTCGVGALDKFSLKQKRTVLPLLGRILQRSVEVRVPSLVTWATSGFNTKAQFGLHQRLHQRLKLKPSQVI